MVRRNFQLKSTQCSRLACSRTFARWHPTRRPRLAPTVLGGCYTWLADGVHVRTRTEGASSLCAADVANRPEWLKWTVCPPTLKPLARAPQNPSVMVDYQLSKPPQVARWLPSARSVRLCGALAVRSSQCSAGADGLRSWPTP